MTFEKTFCVHHWIVNEASLGICQKCQAQKQFPRYWEELVKGPIRLNQTPLDKQPKDQ